MLSVASAVTITRLPTTDKVIALTFDDGPRHGQCEQLLTLLKKENIRATFFMVGTSVEEFPDLVYRINKEGHDLGNHSYQHIALDTQTKDELKDNLMKNQDAIKNITGKAPKYFRAPGGQYSPATYAAAKELGIKTVNWSLNAQDYNLESPFFEKGEAIFVKLPYMIKDEILTEVKPGDIILMHNGTPETVEALKEIIPRLKEQGYRFAKLSEYY